ncbi:hypothetical protein PTQ35_00635 [Campylobacter sp. 46490-21]|uniref:hypothetical protein n=1 Tax=Campylobacter magnus TaxID=3026462 RepID=UPI0023620A8D|nr:hypothetical protein [Campylobacter magnus]MDD0847319.1 hypothetical protein [Campylobacter magnus]
MSCFFLFLCEILRHYSKIWQIDLNLFLFFALFALHPLVGGVGVFLWNSRIPSIRDPRVKPEDDKESQAQR